jgi:hypothetical protein
MLTDGVPREGDDPRTVDRKDRRTPRSAASRAADGRVGSSGGGCRSVDRKVRRFAPCSTMGLRHGGSTFNHPCITDAWHRRRPPVDDQCRQAICGGFNPGREERLRPYPRTRSPRATCLRASRSAFGRVRGTPQVTLRPESPPPTSSAGAIRFRSGSSGPRARCSPDQPHPSRRRGGRCRHAGRSRFPTGDGTSGSPLHDDAASEGSATQFAAAI